MTDPQSQDLYSIFAQDHDKALGYARPQAKPRGERRLLTLLVGLCVLVPAVLHFAG